MKTIADLKERVAAILSGIDIGQIDNLYGAFERAARVFTQKAKIPETQQTQNISLYSGVLDYLINDSIFGTGIIDIRPQGVSRQTGDFVYKKSSLDFDRTKGYFSGTMATFDYFQGTPIIRIKPSFVPPKANIDQMNDVTGWVAAGSASGLVADTSVFYQYPASLRFTLTGSSTGTLTKTITTQDLSPYKGVGVAFLAVRIPDSYPPTGLTDISLKIGSSAGNYALVTQTTGFLGDFSAGNWILVPFDFSTSSDTETPDWTKIAYIQVTFDHTITFANFRVGGLWISQPTPAQILYSSAGFFLNTGVVSNSITDTTDQIILNDSAYSIYEYECALSCLQQTGGSLSDSTMGQIEGILNGTRTRTGIVVTLGLYDLYRAENPTENLTKVGNWYND